MTMTLYASFADAQLAEKAAGALIDQGVNSADISLVAHDAYSQARLLPDSAPGFVAAVATVPESELVRDDGGDMAIYETAPGAPVDLPPANMPAPPGIPSAVPAAPVIPAAVPVAPVIPGSVPAAAVTTVPSTSTPAAVPVGTVPAAAVPTAVPPAGVAPATIPVETPGAPPYPIPPAGAAPAAAVIARDPVTGQILPAAPAANQPLAVDVSPVPGPLGALDHDPDFAGKGGLTTTTAADAEAGAAKGAGIGLGLGILAGLASLLVPGVGLVIGGGALATALGAMAASTAAGAIAGGVTGYLRDQGVPEDAARSYQSAVEHGGAILAVRAPSGSLDSASEEAILTKYGAYDIKVF